LETVRIRKILPLSSKNTGECGLRCYFYRSGCEGESICQKKMKILLSVTLKGEKRIGFLVAKKIVF
jgi:hypothetical protein